jgi:hypothetical protein
MRPSVLLLLTACGPNALEPNGPGAGGGGGDDEFQEPPTCEQSVPIMFERTEAPPDVLLVVDKSGSMAQPLDFTNFTSKWDVMVDALRQVVEASDATINFGLALYPVGDECGTGTVSVPIAPNAAAAVMGGLNGVTFPDGATPTHATLMAAATYYQARAANPNGRYVLLATDGEPNCGPLGPEDDTSAETVAAATALATAGVKTYVIGFGSGFGTNTGLLEDVAMAGGTMQYFQANSPEQLAMALMQISGQVTVPSCTYELTSAPDDPSRLAVSVNGTPVPRSPTHTTGWDYDPATNSITFYGASCSELQSGTITEVHVDYGCGGPVVD